MKVAICAKGKGLDAEVDQRFGRCSYFVIVDPDSCLKLDAIPNKSAESAGGAGPQAVRQLSSLGVEAVILGNLGPNAATALEAANIRAYSGAEGTVEQAMQKLREKKLFPLSEANVSSHAGMRERK